MCNFTSPERLIGSLTRCTFNTRRMERKIRVYAVTRMDFAQAVLKFNLFAFLISGQIFKRVANISLRFVDMFFFPAFHQQWRLLFLWMLTNALPFRRMCSEIGTTLDQTFVNSRTSVFLVEEVVPGKWRAVMSKICPQKNGCQIYVLLSRLDTSGLVLWPVRLLTVRCHAMSKEHGCPCWSSETYEHLLTLSGNKDVIELEKAVV